MDKRVSEAGNKPYKLNSAIKYKKMETPHFNSRGG